MKDINTLQHAIGYAFHDVSLLRLALTHRSFEERAPGQPGHNQRLEYLGDAALQLVVSEKLYDDYPTASESGLSQGRAVLVCEDSLAACARAISLGCFIFMGKGEETIGARNRDSMLADTMEAVIGAVYLDGGFGAAKALVLALLNGQFDSAMDMNSRLDAKTTLAQMLPPDTKISYKIVRESGPDHARHFTAEVWIDNTASATGEGWTKKDAERNAARAAIKKRRK
jgi:ribonuclease-3